MCLSLGSKGEKIEVGLKVEMLIGSSWQAKQDHCEMVLLICVAL